MRILFVLASLLGMAFVSEASRFDTFFNSERQNRQLFVTPPSKIRKTSDESTVSRTSRGDHPKISTVFLSSSSGAPTEASPTINYIPLNQATSGSVTTEDVNSPSTGGSSTIKFYPSTSSRFSTTQSQISSFATSKLPTTESDRSTSSPASQTRSTAFKEDGKPLQENKPESQHQDSFTVRRNTATIQRTKEYPPMTTPSLATSPETPASKFNFPSTYSIAATQPSIPAPSSNKGQNNKENEVDGIGVPSINGTDGEEQRSALIRMPSRDAQVIFLADDPEAAAKIPGLLTQLQEHSRNHPTAQIFPHSRRVPTTQPSSVRYSPDDRITIADTEYTLVDFHTTVDDLRTSGTGLGGRTLAMDDSTETTIIVEGRDSGDLGTSRQHPGFPSRGGPSSFDYRSPFGQAGGGSPVISKEADSFSSFPHSTFLRSRPGSTLSRPVLNMTRVTHIEAECQDDYMRIHTQFNGTFGGLIYSAGYAYDKGCIYINGTGRNLYDFHIQLNRCGTLGGNEKGELDIRGRPTQKNMMWNTLTVQYNPLIEEEWDEHFKVTCEYGYDFWKTVTFPFLDVEVQTGNPVVFTLTPPECHMEIRYGYGTAGQRITGPVRVGDPLTLVIYMRSELDGFDIVVSDCFAHNGGNKRISLIDHYGCPVDEKLISHFEGTKSDDGHYETQVYAFMKTFRFTGSPALYIECDVRMCHGECPPQPCHWKRTTRERRSLPEATHAPQSSNVSESLNLFQALQVLRDEDPLPHAPSLEGTVEGSICLKNGTFSAAAGAVTALLGLLTAACVVMCLRSRRIKKEEKGTSPKPAILPTYKSDFIPPSKRRLE